MGDQEFNAKRSEVLITALQELITTYKKTKNVPLKYIISGLRNLNEMFGSLCSKIANLERQEININFEAKEEIKGLHVIASFIGRFEGLDKIPVNSCETNLQTLTLNAAFASSLSQALENLAYIKNKHLLYYTTLSLFTNLELHLKTTLDYRNEVEKQIWKKITKNVIQRFYPTTLRTCLTYLGPRLIPDCFQTNEWMNNLIEKIRRLLYIDLVPLLNQNAQMVDRSFLRTELFPQDIIDDEGTYFFINRFNEKIKIACPQDLTSVLEELNCGDKNHQFTYANYS